MGSYSKKQLQDQIKHAGFFFLMESAPMRENWNIILEGKELTEQM